MGRILYDSIEESKGDVRATRELVMCWGGEERKRMGGELSQLKNATPGLCRARIR